MHNNEGVAVARLYISTFPICLSSYRSYLEQLRRVGHIRRVRVISAVGAHFAPCLLSRYSLNWSLRYSFKYISCILYISKHDEDMYKVQ